MKSSLEIARVVEVTFYLKENPRPSDFITEANLRDFGLASIEGPHMVFVASLLIVIPPLD